MADTPKTPMSRAEYDVQIMRHSLEALKRSYQLLEETNAHLAAKRPQASEPGSDQGSRQDPERDRE